MILLAVYQEEYISELHQCVGQRLTARPRACCAITSSSGKFVQTKCWAKLFVSREGTQGETVTLIYIPCNILVGISIKKNPLYSASEKPSNRTVFITELNKCLDFSGSSSFPWLIWIHLLPSNKYLNNAHKSLFSCQKFSMSYVRALCQCYFEWRPRQLERAPKKAMPQSDKYLLSQIFRGNSVS